MNNFNGLKYTSNYQMAKYDDVRPVEQNWQCVWLANDVNYKLHASLSKITFLGICYVGQNKHIWPLTHKRPN